MAGPRPGAAALLALAVTRGAPLPALALALMARTQAVSGDTDPATTRPGPDDRTLVRVALGVVAARLLAPVVLVPAALVGSLVLVLAVVLVLAGGVTVAARVAGLG